MCLVGRWLKKKKRERVYVILGAALRRATSGGYSETRVSCFTATEVFHCGTALNSFVWLVGTMACVRAGCYRLSTAETCSEAAVLGQAGGMEPVECFQYHGRPWNKSYSIGVSLKIELPIKCPERNLSSILSDHCVSWVWKKLLMGCSSGTSPPSEAILPGSGPTGWLAFWSFGKCYSNDSIFSVYFFCLWAMCAQFVCTIMRKHSR